MKTLAVTLRDLQTEGRWDIDYFLPPVEITKFPAETLVTVDQCVDIVAAKRDPTTTPEEKFLYIDISSVDVTVGVAERPQELVGEEAPSRARKVVDAYDVIVSTCRPTRGAIAVVTEDLHKQICSTGFSVLRVKPGVNPYYLHYALRLPSTMEQFRKWSTGSSYPAILDEDIKKTRIPLPNTVTQDRMAKLLLSSLTTRQEIIKQANSQWAEEASTVFEALVSNSDCRLAKAGTETRIFSSITEIETRRAALRSKYHPTIQKKRPKRKKDDVS